MVRLLVVHSVMSLLSLTPTATLPDGINIDLIYHLIAALLIIFTLFSASAFGMLIVIVLHFRSVLQMVYQAIPPEAQQLIARGYQSFDGTVKRLNTLDDIAGKIIFPPAPGSVPPDAFAILQEILLELKSLPGALTAQAGAGGGCAARSGTEH
jgi:hypothetical protein